MAALANAVTQLGALMAANPVATKIIGLILGCFVFDYLVMNYGTSTAPPPHSFHPDAVSWIPLKPSQKAAVMIFEDEPERVLPNKNAVHMSSYVFIMLAIVVILWLLRKSRQFYWWLTAPAAVGDDDDRPEDQSRPLEVPAIPDPGSRKDASTQTSSPSNAENSRNVAHADAMKKAQEAAADLESQVAALRQQGRNDAKINGDLKRELAAAKAKSEDLELQCAISRSHMDDQINASTQLRSRVKELEAQLAKAEQSQSDLNDRVTATTLQKEEALERVETELVGSREQVETLTQELVNLQDQVNTLALDLTDSQDQAEQATMHLTDTEDQFQRLTQEREALVETHFRVLAAVNLARQHDLLTAVGRIKYRDYLIEGNRESLSKERTRIDELETEVWHLRQQVQVKNIPASTSPQHPDAQEDPVATEVQNLDKEASGSDSEFQPVNTPTSTPPLHPVEQEEPAAEEAQESTPLHHSVEQGEPVAEEAQESNTEAIEYNVQAPVVDTQAQVPIKVELPPGPQSADSVPKVLPPHLRRNPAKATETGLSPTAVSTSETGVTDAVPHAVPSGIGAMGGSTIANPPRVHSGSPVKWHCDTCHCAFLEEIVSKSAHQDVCKNWADDSYSRSGSDVGYPPDWEHAVEPYPTASQAFWMHQMSRPTVSRNTVAPSNPLKLIAEVFRSADFDDWSNEESHVARDDEQVANARARQEYERQAREIFRPELRETGKAQLIPALIMPAASVSQAIAPISTAPTMQKNAALTKGMGASKWSTKSSQATQPEVEGGQHQKTNRTPSDLQPQATVPPIAAPIATPATTTQPSTRSTPRNSPCSVCGGNFKGWKALAIHTPKCQTWAAKVAARQYTSTVYGQITISYPPDWSYSHTDNDPDPKWLIIAKQKVHPIRDARGNKMQAKREAELIERAAEIDRETAEMRKQEAEAEKQAEKQAEEATKAPEATKAQPAMQTAVADVKKKEARTHDADSEKQACLDRMAARAKEAREKYQKKTDKNGGLLPNKAEKPPVKKSFQKYREVPRNGKKPDGKK